MFSTSKCAQEQQLSIDVGVDLWLYAGLSRNVHRKGLSIFSGSKRSILCVHLFDKYWYTGIQLSGWKSQPLIDGLVVSTMPKHSIQHQGDMMQQLAEIMLVFSNEICK